MCHTTSGDGSIFTIMLSLEEQIPLRLNMVPPHTGQSNNGCPSAQGSNMCSVSSGTLLSSSPLCLWVCSYCSSGVPGYARAAGLTESQALLSTTGPSRQSSA
ncbi:hypothetical protein WJX79_007541 [Trebouxia sp. C0005]